MCQLHEGSNESAPPFCSNCQAHLDANLHPVVCTGCRQAKGAQASISWVDHRRLSRWPDLQDLIKKNYQYGPLVFVIPQCQQCVEA